MLFTRQKSGAGANTESPPITQPEINIREVRTPSRTVFTKKHNQLFVQQVLQYSQYFESEVFHYHFIFLNESST